MNRLPLIAVAALLLTGAAGPATCSLQNTEASLLALAGQIKAKLPVAVASLQNGVVSLCMKLDSVTGAAETAKVLLAAQGGTGPKTTQNISLVNTSINTLNRVCATQSVTTSGPALAQLFMEGLAAYQAVTGAINSANGT